LKLDGRRAKLRREPRASRASSTKTRIETWYDSTFAI